MSFLIEFFQFLKERKKYWLLPIIIVLALFGALIGNALSDLAAAILDPATRDIAGGIFAGCAYVVIIAYVYVKVAKPKF